MVHARNAAARPVPAADEMRICGKCPRCAAFSLVELVVVLVIIGIIAAIAIPRFSAASQGSRESALRADLKELREAIELYGQEHDGLWPAERAASADAMDSTPEAFELQLTGYTAPRGQASQTSDGDHSLGPYLRKIPELPLGKRRGDRLAMSLDAFGEPGSAPAGYGWEFLPSTGEIRANCTPDEVGANGVPYYQW